MRSTYIAALIAMSVVPAACGDSDPSGPGTRAGTFELELSGAVEETAEGPAWFGSDVNEEGEPVFAVIFGDGDERHTVVVGKLGSQRPAVGEYPLGQGETDWTLVHMLADGDELEGLFFAGEGVITITHSSSTRLRGRIEYVAFGILGEEEAEVEGVVNFEAVTAPTQMMMQTQPAVLLKR